jgi:hypothetical protein
MNEQPNEERTALDRITLFLPWIGGAVVLLLIAGVIRSSLSSHDDLLPKDDSHVVVNKPILPAASGLSNPVAEVTPAAFQHQTIETTASSNTEIRETSAPPPVPSNSQSATPPDLANDPDVRSSPSYGSASRGEVHVRGYTRKDGTYVQPYTRRAPGSGGGGRRGK